MSSLYKSKGKWPLKTLQIGCGSFGHHLSKHLEDKFESFDLVPDRQSPRPDFKSYDYIFLATNDSSLQSLIEEISLKSPQTKAVHFSGFYHFKKALGLHPVASFNKRSDYNLDQITFVADGEVSEPLDSVFPKRKWINPLKKKDYHTYLSVTSNALQLIVNSIGKDFDLSLGIDADLLKEIVIQSLVSERENGAASFSGPWMRGEKEQQDETVENMSSDSLKDLNALFKKEIEKYKKNKEGSFEHS